MKNVSNSCSYTRSILSVGFLCLLLVSTARGQTSYTITDLGTLGGSFSEAFGINNRGQIVGESSLVIGIKKPLRAFLYSGGQMQDLNNLLAPNSGWKVRSATGINDAGQIVGDGLHNGLQRAFLMTPIR